MKVAAEVLRMTRFAEMACKRKTDASSLWRDRLEALNQLKTNIPVHFSFEPFMIFVMSNQQRQHFEYAGEYIPKHI